MNEAMTSESATATTLTPAPSRRRPQSAFMPDLAGVPIMPPMAQVGTGTPGLHLPGEPCAECDVCDVL
jgi:hypothetical protein